MTSVRLAYVFVAIFAATLYSSAVAVSAITNSDTALIGNTDTGLDSGVQRRLRGTVKEDLANDERAVSISGTEGGVMAALRKFTSGFSLNGFASMQEKIRATTQMKLFYEKLSKMLKSPGGYEKLKTMFTTKSKLKKTGAAPQNVEKETALKKEPSLSEKKANDAVRPIEKDNVILPEKEANNAVQPIEKDTKINFYPMKQPLQTIHEDAEYTEKVVQNVDKSITL